MTPVRVLVVDDSVVMRRAVGRMLAADAGIEVSPASDGAIALQRIRQAPPDLVILDVEMPGMSGLETLVEIRRSHPRLPVIMFSALTGRGSATTVEALALGASDYLAKPSSLEGDAVQAELLRKVHALCPREAGVRVPGLPALRLRTGAASARSDTVDAVVIGCSTGGPNALATVLPALPAAFPVPVLIVQHMPPMFTGLLAERLQRISRLDVREATAGVAPHPGGVLLAPGGSHMVVERAGGGVAIALNEEPPENSCRPAVDVLFRSARNCYGARLLAVVLTGMGRDGALGCQAIAEGGGQVIAQDEATSVVWGMPGAVAAEGLAEKLLPLDQIAAEITRRVAPARSLTP